MKKRKLYDYQKEALAWAQERSFVPLFMEMRLGKTIVAIRWASQLCGRILVVCPLAVCPVWQEELSKEEHSSVLLTGSWKNKERMLEENDVDWYITNYESLNRKRKPSLIFNYGWDAVILDESTFIRSPKAIRTKMCRKYFNQIQHRCILTGLPNPESSMDYFEQMAFVYGSFLGSETFWEFRCRYFQQQGTQWNWQPRKGTLSAIKHAVDADAYSLSRRQAGVGSKKVYEKRYVTLPRPVRKEYDNVEKNFRLGDKETKWIIVCKVWLARLAGGQPEEAEYCSPHKAKEVGSLMRNELANEQCVIWFRFTSEIMFVHYWLNTKNISNDFITGEVDPAERQRTTKRFRENKIQCLLVQLKCGKFGLDYSCTSTAIYYSNSFEYEERRQSEDRIIHPDKKEPVLIIDLLTENTIDEDVHSALREKGMNAKFFTSKIIENFKRRTKNG